MAKRFLSTLLVLVLCFGLTACQSAVQDSEQATFVSNGTAPGVSTEVSFREIAKTETLSLSLCENTTLFRVTNLMTGAVYDSGVVGGSDRDKASITLSYLDDTGVTNTLDSFMDAVKDRQFEITKKENGFEIKYSLGSVDGIVYAPKVWTAERYERFYDACDASGKRLMAQVYKLVDLDSMDAAAAATAREKYPQAAEGPIYAQKVDALQSSLENRLHEALKKAGYTDEDYAQDAAFAGDQGGSEDVAFNVVMDVSIKGNALSVTVPESKLESKGNATVQSLNVLPNFSRVAQGTEGYYLLPDGSGSIMNFFNQKNGLQAYSVNIYGDEETVKEKELVYNTQQAILPVFGCHSGNAGWLAVIEDGDALASVTAVPGDSKTRPYAYSAFRILQSAKINAISASAGESSTSYYINNQSKKRDGDLTVSYHFLSGEDADYSGMARYYRGLLFNGRTPTDTPKKLPLGINLIGNITVTEKLGGISYKKSYELTTPEQALAICTDLKESTDDLTVILSGYADGGYAQNFLKSAKVSSALETVSRLMNENGFRYSVAYETLYAYDGGLFRNVSNRYVSRMLSRDVAVLYESDPAYFNFNKNSAAKRVLNPQGMDITFATVKKLAEKNAFPSVSLFSVGKALNAEYNENSEVERQTMLELLCAHVKSVKETGTALITSVGNAPIAVLADAVVSLPLTSSNFDITDYSVPFAAMVYSGHLTYSGDAMNLCYADDSDYLHLIENGAAPYCIVAAQHTDKLRNTEHNALYSIDYTYLQQTIKARYETVKEAVGDVFGTCIVRHERLQDNVFRTTFASGKSVVVNYNSKPVTLSDGVTVPAKGFWKGASE